MKILELTLVIVAAVALTVWRGVALYRQTFHKREL